MPLLLYGSCRCTGSTIHIEKQHCNQKDSFIYWPWWNLFHHENSEGLNYFNQLKPTDLMWEYHLFSCSKLTRTFNGSFLLWSAIRDSLPDHPAESTTILGSCLCRFPFPCPPVSHALGLKRGFLRWECCILWGQEPRDSSFLWRVAINSLLC